MRFLFQHVRCKRSYHILQLSYFSWKKLCSLLRIIRLVSLFVSSTLLISKQLLSSLSGYLLKVYYFQWKLFLQSQKTLKKWIAFHLAMVQSIPSVVKPIETDVPMILSEVSISTPHTSVACRSHKTCRCVRCLSRYGHLGAKTRKNYIHSPMAMFSSPLNTSISQSGVKSFPDQSFNTIASEDVSFRYSRETEGARNDSFSFLSRNSQNPNRSSINPPIVVMESTCTATEHLKVYLRIDRPLFSSLLVSHQIDHRTD